jgi:hypothetical protein
MDAAGAKFRAMQRLMDPERYDFGAEESAGDDGVRFFSLAARMRRDVANHQEHGGRCD